MASLQEGGTKLVGAVCPLTLTNDSELNTFFFSSATEPINYVQSPLPEAPGRPLPYSSKRAGAWSSASVTGIQQARQK